MAPKQLFNAMTLAALLLLPAAAFADPEAKGSPLPSPEEANSLLVEGNERFVHNASKRPHQSTKRVAETAAAQRPFVTVLSCSDSRVPPELLFDQGFGDVVSVRVAGNVANSDAVASVEYGVDRLGTPLLVVMGHTKCGVVSAAAPHAESVPEASKANVFASMATVLRESDSVRERVESGKTRMIGAVYDITTGTVTWLGPHPEQTALVAKGKESAPAEKGHGSSHDAPKDAHGSADDAPKGAHAAHDAPKHGDAGADAKPAEVHAAKDGHGEPAPLPLPLPGPPNPISFAVLALVCTIGGGISGRLSK